MIVVDFSENDNSNFNVMQCIICSLLIYSEYFTFESLKKHFQNASHCSFAIQFQQKVELKIVKKKIVEKSKIESFSVLVSLVKSLNTYEEKLTILANWIWFDSLNKKTMTIVEFRNIHDEYRAKCMHCSLTITRNRKFESLKKHIQKSFECSFVLQLEIAKLISIVSNFDYFDSILLCDIQKFNLFCEIASFVQQFRQCQHQYRESDLLILLFESFRDFVLIWYKQQNENEIVKKNLNEWLEVLIIAFFAKSSKFEIFTSNSFVSRFSFQYHFCFNYFVFFSSLIRLLQHNQSICKKVVCKHCDEIFESNNKFHEHVRQHHTKKKIIVSRRNFNKKKNKITLTISTTTISSISFKTTTKISIFRFVTFSKRSRNSFISFVTFATSKQIF